MRWAAVLCAAALAGALVACGKPTQQPAPQPEWEVVQRSAGPIATTTLLSPLEGAGDGFRESITIVSEPAGEATSAQEFLDAASQRMARELGGFRSLGRGSGTVCGQAAQWMLYEYSAGGLAMKARVSVVVDGERAHSITCLALPDTYDRFLPQFERQVAKLKLE
jgi:hypothetical protein